jgi:hypothetical protein
MLQVKVPIIFFGTPVFSARKDRRYKMQEDVMEEYKMAPIFDG